MSSSMAMICITGHLTRDAELMTTSTGKQVIKFSVAVNTGWGDRKAVTFYNCSAWRENEKLLQFLTKGKLVGITGEPSLREYSTDSGKRQSLDVNANSITLLGGGEKKQEQAGPDVGDGEVIPF